MTASGNAERFDLTAVSPPPLQREFRATWIPTVGNSCWPSKQGLTVPEQKAELVALLDRAKELNFNAVILQVRPACDALYASPIEPWSEYLGGVQGQAPAPYYDPLEFACAEARRRGLELHAWFNPFRARNLKAKSPVSENHITRQRPDLVRAYGSLLWLDPGEPDAQEYTTRVVLDVLQRYDVDAIHFDDYFYPYPEKNAAGAVIDFPDEASWRRYGEGSGLSRSDWRRRNVDDFIRNTYQAIHDAKPWVKFGISPFGIWRPKHPPGIEGLDAFDTLYADARKWIREGWCDYLAPQLYWPIDPPATSFPALLDWWNKENPRQRHIWPGLNALKVGDGWKVSEIARQIEITRKHASSPGQIFWSANALMKHPALGRELKRNAYREPALVPAYPWLDNTPPPSPKLSVFALDEKRAMAIWSNSGSEQPWQWILQTRVSGKWSTRILASDKTLAQLEPLPDIIAVTALDRFGNASHPTALQRAE